MTTFLLIRHGDTDVIGRTLAGRMPGIYLNSRGEERARLLAERLAPVPMGVVCCSPLERTHKTAEIIAGPHGLPVQVCEGLLEVEPGAWTGKAFFELDQDPRWKQYNSFRCGIRPPGPGGELMVEVQSRMIAEVERLRHEHPDGIIALVSHGDPIKTVVAHYVGIPLDLSPRIEVSPASLSVIHIDDYGARILCINQTADLLKFWE